MIEIAELYRYLDEFAPFRTALPWDNSGFLVRGAAKETQLVLLALDLTPEAVEEARTLGAGVILSHHPVIFEPLKRLCADDVVALLVRCGISAICAHTNLDLARGGVNDVLARRLQLHDIEPLAPPDESMLSLGRIGNFALPVEAGIAITFIKKNLGARGVRYVPGRPIIRRVAVAGGAGADLVSRAAELGADLLVTGDCKHHQLLEARRLGLTLLDAGHYCTEHMILEPLAERLRAHFGDAAQFRVSQTEQDPTHYL